MISGPGATGTALQDIIDGFGDDFGTGLLAIIAAPATIIDGFVNGGYGPNLVDLVGDLLPFPNIFAGGLVNPLTPGSNTTLQGLFPTADLLVRALLEAVDIGGPEALQVETTGFVEQTVNDLVFSLVASPTVTFTNTLIGPIAELLGLPPALTAALPILSLGLVGPLISGPGATGTAIQFIIDEFLQGDFGSGVLATIGAPATIIDGFVNGGYGPDVAPLLFPPDPDVPNPPPLPFTTLAGGLINRGNLPLLLPGSIPTLQGLVGAVLELVDVGAPEMLTTEEAKNVSTFTGDEKVEAPAERKDPIRELVRDVRDVVLPGAADGPEVLPKKNRPLLNIFKVNPLDRDAKKETKDGAGSLGSDNEATGKHRFGTPVRDLVKRVLSGGDDDDDDGGAQEGQEGQAS